MRILIAGAGEVGTHLAKMLCNANHDVILMDEDEEKLKRIDSHFDLMTIVGSMTSLEDLREANVRMCDLFIAVPPYQDMSILAAILAKKIGAKKTVARVNNHEYLIPENRDFFKQMGIDELIYPEQLAASEIVASLKQVGVRQMFEFSEGKLLLVGLKLRSSSPMVEKTITDIAQFHSTREYNTVAIDRKGKTLIPRGKDKLLDDDLVYFITTKAGLPLVIEDAGKKQFEVRNVMIFGGSRIGSKVAKEIETNYNVKLIEIDKERCNKIADDLEHVLVINGDGRSVDLLKDEGIHKIDAFIAVTPNSEVNILACQVAKKMGVRKTVAEVENMDYIDLAENIGIGTLVNKKLIAASHIYRYTLHASVSNVLCLTSTQGEVIELVAQEGSKITSDILGELSIPKEVNIGGVIRNDQVIIPTSETQILPNDRVVVFSMTDSINKIEKLFTN